MHLLHLGEISAATYAAIYAAIYATQIFLTCHVSLVVIVQRPVAMRSNYQIFCFTTVQCPPMHSKLRGEYQVGRAVRDERVALKFVLNSIECAELVAANLHVLGIVSGGCLL